MYIPYTPSPLPPKYRAPEVRWEGNKQRKECLFEKFAKNPKDKDYF